MQPTNDGWENVLSNPTSNIVHWPNISLPPPPPIQHMPFVSFATSHAHYV